MNQMFMIKSKFLNLPFKSKSRITFHRNKNRHTNTLTHEIENK